MSMAKSLMQGDQHAIPFVLKMKDGTLITDAMVKTVVLNLGNLSRQYPGDVTYKNGQWLFPVTQAQTFAMRGSVEPQARVEFLNDDIFGGAGEPVELQNALNKGIIGTDGTTAAKQNAPTMQTELQGAILVIVAAAGVEFSAEGAVRYDKTQSLTDAQKQQARDNIGVVDVPTPSAENVGKIPVSKQVGDGYKYVMEDKSTSDLSLGLTGASVGQVPVVESIDTQGKPTTWVPSSAPGILLVAITAENNSGESKLICDRTNAEIYEAFSAGKIVMADIPNWLSENRMRCIYANDTTARFSVVTRGSAASAIQSFTVLTNTTSGVQTVIMDDEALLITFTGSPDNAGRLITFDMMGVPFITQFNGLLYGEQDGSVTSLGFVTEDDNGKFLRVVDGMWQAVTVDNANGGSF